MIIIKINDYHWKYNNCLEDSYGTILKHINLNNDIINIGSWYFEYNIDIGNKISDKLTVSKHSYDYYFEELGIITRKVCIDNICDAIDVIDLNLKKNNPVIIDLRSDYCHWLSSEDDFIFQHFCIIVDRSEKYLYCLDSSTSCDVYPLTYTNYLKGTTHIIEVNKSVFLRECSYMTLKKYLKSEISLNYKKMLNSANAFLKDISQRENLIFSDYRELCLKIKYISHSRYKLCALLKKYFTKRYMKDKYFKSAIENLDKCGDYWMAIRTLIIQENIVIKNNYINKNKALKLLENIIYLERISLESII